MMKMEITKEFLEHAVPAFETSDDQIFQRLQSFFDDVKTELEMVIGPDADKYLADWMELAKKYVCTRAARLAIPQLDLVLTQTGFGIVSTNNVAPASKDRVAALTEQLRKSESITYDMLLSDLALFTEWKDTGYCKRVVDSLLWNSSTLRDNGVTLDGERVYLDEYQQLRPAINKAEFLLTEIISDELYQHLVASLLNAYDKLPEHYLWVRGLCVRFLAEAIMTKSCPSVIRDKLETYLDKYADEFPEYKNSDVYKAKNVGRHENTKKGKCYFW